MQQDPNELMKMTIRLIGNDVRAAVPYSTYRELANEFKESAKTSPLYSFTALDGTFVVLRPSQIQAIEITPAKTVGKMVGVTVKEIAKVTKKSYVTLVRKINKPGGIALEMESSRRILLSEQNIQQLGLSDSQLRDLKAIEAKRVGRA